MKSFIIVVCVSLAGALFATGCNSGDGGPAFPPNPFGTDPAPKTGFEPPGSGGFDRPPSSTSGAPPATASVDQICAYDCQHIEMLCPGGSGGASCAASCAQEAAYLPGCETQFKTFLVCVETASVSCSSGSAQVNGCDAQISAVEACASGGGL
jgi:hypothetical protein